MGWLVCDHDVQDPQNYGVGTGLGFLKDDILACIETSDYL